MFLVPLFFNLIVFQSPSIQFLIFRLLTKAGPANGLILDLDIEQDEYLPITEKAGIKVLLHSGSEIVFPDNTGILAAPGYVTSIGIKRSEIYMLPQPYGNCISADNTTNEIKNIFQQLGYTYTKDACLRTCLQKRIFESCRCIDLDLANMVRVLNYNDWLDLDNTKSLQICNKTMAKCMDTVQEKFEKHELGCEEMCPPACTQKLFQTTVSTAVWPADRHLDRYVKFVNKTFAKKKIVYNWTSNPHEHIRKNFLRLEIYYETLRYEVISTSATYHWNNLLGNIGGQLGLWLGFSVLTAIEVCQFIIQVLIHLFKTYLKRFRKSKERDLCNNKIDIPLPSESTLV
ncbi:degenerin del-1-like [Physella acuta]|uniref:degenerin del-1-like n=1 Tax=Physella acuta TaxID=109671 RepID=UPI0027DBFE14|nr:degenerin del-1-like [Physella acuta]